MKFAKPMNLKKAVILFIITALTAASLCACITNECSEDDCTSTKTESATLNTTPIADKPIICIYPENATDESCTSWPEGTRKPIIYSYPESTTEITVKLSRPENITVSYPAYADGWTVLAEPDGTLTDVKSGRKLYALYYECENAQEFTVCEDGFVVAGCDSAAFLEEKLAILGLNEREAEEFIIYWLPVLEANRYNYIRFATADEINANEALEISPAPDSIIRVWMSFKGLDEKISVEEQILETPERSGYTVVEWGGSEIR